MKAYVYVIGQQLNEPYNNCYVGVTVDLNRRWKQHLCSQYTIGNYIRDNNLSYDKNMKVIWHGEINECFLLEEELRPLPNIGLNEAIGGHGGYTSYSKERNDKISKKLLGRTFSDKTRKRMSDSTKGMYAGANNPRSKKWKITTPNGNVEYIEGKLNDFCEKNNLIFSVLYNNIGEFIEKPNTKTLGGFREKYEGHLKKRLNTVGWKLERMEK